MLSGYSVYHEYIRYAYNAVEAMSWDFEECNFGECDSEEYDFEENSGERIESCARLIVKKAIFYSSVISSEDITEDLIQAGLIGLKEAWPKYDPGKRVKLSTYANYYITEKIMEAINEEYCPGFKIPKEQWSRMWKVVKLYNEYSGKEGDRRPEESVSEILNMDLDDVYEYLELYHNMRYLESLDECCSEEDDTTLGDLIADDDADSVEDTVMYSSMKAEVKEILQILPEREAAMLKMRFSDENPTLQEIGKAFGISAVRVYQITNSALEKLRRSGRCQALREYLTA